MRPSLRVTAVAGAVMLLAGAPSPARGDAQGASALDDQTLIALAFALALTPPPTAPAASAAAVAGAKAEPEIELVTTVRTRSIVFSDVPRVNMQFAGDGPRRTRWQVERVNLPAHVEPGVAYRDVVVRLRLTTTLSELAVLARDAKSASRGLRVARGQAPDAAARPSAPPPARTSTPTTAPRAEE
jgi:hypothetical protein